MRFRDIVRGLSEDVKTIKKARESGRIKKECAMAKKYGTYKERVIACGLSKILSHSSKKIKHRKSKKCYIRRKRR